MIAPFYSKINVHIYVFYAILTTKSSPSLFYISPEMESSRFLSLFINFYETATPATAQL